MKITLGDVTITIEPGDDPNQVIEMAKAVGLQQNTVPPTRSFASDDAAPSRKRVPRCKGRGECEGRYHNTAAVRQLQFMCETYEYIAAYKQGRRSEHVATWADISHSAASSRIKTLMDLGLVERIGKGYIYAATSS